MHFSFFFSVYQQRGPLTYDIFDVVSCLKCQPEIDFPFFFSFQQANDLGLSFFEAL